MMAHDRAMTRYRTSPTEAETERTITEAVAHHHGYAWHVRDSRRMNVEHMPDLIVVLPARDGNPGVVGLLETL